MEGNSQTSDCNCHDSVSKIRKYLMVFAVPVTGLLITIAGFYFNTRSTLQAHEKEINIHREQIYGIQQNMFSKQDMKDFKEELRETLNEIKGDIKEIKNRK